MRNTLVGLTAVMALSGAITASALAAEPALIGTDAPRSEWLSVGQAANLLTSQGYDVLEIRTDAGVYEIRAYDAKGEHIEAFVDPMNGKVLMKKRGHGAPRP
ncbi:PepSY domain-containing protein [Roseospira navarrensis]|nr:PepSY domain-containing protein [Roseospira navarrensis]